ncbi:MAG: hypothetical protein JWM83_2795 [Candidatus Angelobacter sp.]|nr:hypothetical protein [Candidatus Angelobacter sp.]
MLSSKGCPNYAEGHHPEVSWIQIIFGCVKGIASTAQGGLHHLGASLEAFER